MCPQDRSAFRLKIIKYDGTQTSMDDSAINNMEEAWIICSRGQGSFYFIFALSFRTNSLQDYAGNCPMAI